MRTPAGKLFVVSTLALSSACVTSDPARPEPATATASTVRYFGDPPVLDQSARIGTQNAAQSFTPAPRPKALKTTLRTKWNTRVAKTDARSSVLAAGDRIVIGTEQGAWLLDARTGEQRSIARTGDGAPVRGVAMDADGLVVVSAKGHVAKLSLAGAETWRAALDASAAAAPALLDVNGDRVADVAIGTGGGAVVMLDGKTGRKLWQRPVGGERRVPIEAAVVAGDVDRDGTMDVVVGSGNGLLTALRGRDGAPLWLTKISAPVTAAPVLADVDAHGGLEVVTASSDGMVAIFDGATGRLLWNTRVERDDGDAEGLPAAPAILPGPRIGALVVPTARNKKTDGLVVLSENERRFRSLEGPVTATPAVLRLDPDGTPDAIVGTEAGDLIAIDATGGRTFLAGMGAPILAAPLVTDVDADGVRDLVVVTSDGTTTCYSTGAADPPPRETNLGWAFARGRDAARPLEERTPKEK